MSSVRKRSRSPRRRDDDRDSERSSKRDRDRDRDRDDDRRRDRSRSRDRDYRRKKSRSRSPDRRKRRSPSPEKAKEKIKTPPKQENDDDKKKREQMQLLLQQLAAAQAQQSNVQLRKLYVGNLQIGIGLKEQHIAEFFNTAMQAAGLANGVVSPVQSVWMSSEGKFAFVEFRTPQDATNAMLLDGALFHGRPLRIGRPAEMPNSQKNTPALNNLLPALALASSGLSGFSALGQTPALSTLLQRPFAGMAIPGQPGSSSSSVPMAPTKILVLSGMITEEDLKDDDGYQDIVDDIRDECSKYGTVIDLEIPRPGAPGVGKAFVKFPIAEQAQAANAKLSGRKFAGRTVTCAFLDELSYDQRRFT